MKRIVRREARTTLLPDLPPLIARLFSARGVEHVSQVDHRLAHLASPAALKGLDVAVALLCDIVETDKRILIIGDFDADGATATALLILGLSALGARHVDYLVPNRFEFGYGLTPEIVAVAARREPDLIITVDNGISSVDGVAAARERGIRVLVTDHHLPGAVMPAADAIVNPNQAGCEFPSKHLAGVGVAFYLLSATRAQLRNAGWFAREGIAEPNLADYLDLVALGTIADVVPMDYNNRILAQEGIRRIRGGRSRPGIRALVELSGAECERVLARDLAYGVAPRLNAAGRLEDISLGIECLVTSDEQRAFELAKKLDALNRERKSIEDEMKLAAQDALDDESLTASRDSFGVCLFREDWHQGVVGIVASRIKDEIHRPVIAFARAGAGELKGSGRSIAGLHIRDALDSIAARNPGLLIKFGGHAMAAGLSLRPQDFERFAAEFDAEARRWLSDDDLEQVLVSDGEIGEEITLDLARHVMDAAPWGQGFAEPVFDGEFEVLAQRIVGGRHLKMKLRPRDSQRTIEAIAFNQGSLIEGRYRRLAYRVDINTWRGVSSVQLIVEATELA